MSAEEKKISILGLDNAGKSSIALYLDRKFSLVSKLTPTKLANINTQSVDILGLQLSIWDLGGQKQYRSEYLKNKEMYFSNLSGFFYVIDIQDNQRYEISINYLANLAKVVKEYNPELEELVILLHKYDPDIQGSEKYLNKIESLKDKIKSLSLDFNITFYPTSIYDGANLMKAFSFSVIRKCGKAKLLENILKEYTKETWSSAAILLNESYLFLASRATDDKYLNFCTDIIPDLSKVMDRLNRWDVKTEDSIMNVLIKNGKAKQRKKGIIFMKRIDIENYGSVYLMTLCLNKKVRDRAYEYIPQLAEKIKTIID
jgi:small GTP-binding protein